MKSVHHHPGWKHTVWPILAGLAAAQFLGTIFVRLSNLDVWAQTQATTAAGWFSIPCGPAVPLLKTYAAAFWGGLFYTLSIGAILTLMTWSVLRLRRMIRHRRRWTWLAASVWGVLVVAVNLKGPSLFATLFVVGIPLATSAAARVAAPSVPAPVTGRLNFLPLLVLLALTVLWSTQFNRELFIAIRDHVLLSNSIGQRVNDFYYRYTLYAAEAFKSFGQKTIRTCRLDGVTDPVLNRQLERALARMNVLNVPGVRRVDVAFTVDGDQLRLSSHNGPALRVDRAAFFKDMGHWLQVYADAGDRLQPLRRLIFLGVLLGFPILLYLSVYGLVRVFIGLVWDARNAVWITSGICLFIGILLFIPMLKGRDRPIPTDKLAAAFDARQWEERVSALRIAERDEVDISGLMDVDRYLHSPRVVERYWLARALVYSHSVRAYRQLLDLCRDPHPNVVCQAYYALGRRGDRRAIQPIMEQMRRSDHWYTQYYGYNAIRSLGWIPTRSRPKP